MLRYRFPSCRSIRILMIRMSGSEPLVLLGGLLPQEAERRCDFVGVDGVNVAGVESLGGGDVSTSKQDTDGDLICCNKNNSNYDDDLRTKNQGCGCFSNRKKKIHSCIQYL